MNEISVENGAMKFVAEENGRNPEKTYPKLRFVHYDSLMEWSNRELENPTVGGDRLTSCAAELLAIVVLKHYITQS